MSLDKWTLMEVVLTLTATGTVMWLVRKFTLGSGYGPLLGALTGIALLLGLVALDVPSAGYILAALVALLALGFLLGVLGEM